MLNTIKKGTEFLCLGKNYTIDLVKESTNQIRAFDEENGREVLLDKADFFESFENGETEFVIENPLSESEAKKGVDCKYLLVSQKNKQEINRKQAYVAAITGPDGSMISGTKEIKKAINRKARELEDKKRWPSPSTVKRWYVRLKANNGDVTSLIRRARRQSSLQNITLAEQTKKVRCYELFYACVHEFYLKPTNVSMKWVLMMMENKIEEDEYFADITPPSLPTLYRWFNKLPEYEKHMGKKGYLDAARHYTNGYPIEHPHYLLERVELDHTKLDIKLVDPDTGEALDNPWMTAFIDAKSRMIIGFHLSMHVPDISSVILAFRNAVLSKNYVKNKYGKEIVTEWPCQGLMQQIVTDNGRELLASDVQEKLSQFAEIVYNRKGTPQHKGKIERFFKTINEGLLHGCEGTTKSNYKQLGDYKSDQHAWMTFDMLVKVVHKWIIDVYHNTYHTGINNSPLQCWKKNAINYVERLPKSISQIDQLLWKTTDRNIQKYGIQLYNLKYQSPELMQIAKQYGLSTEVDILFDEQDLRLIRVILPNSTETIDVPCVRTEYVEGGLTLKDHKNVMKELNFTKKQIMQAGDKLLFRMKMELKEMEQAELKSLKKSNRKAAAKRKLVSSETVTDTSPKTMGESTKIEVLKRAEESVFSVVDSMEAE